MTTAELCALGLCAALIVLDYATGVAAAVMHGELQSSKMREGLWHKLGEVGAIILAYIVAQEGHCIGLPYQIDLLIPSVVIWISIMEVASVLENLALLNPDLGKSSFLQIFKRSNDIHEHAATRSDTTTATPADDLTGLTGSELSKLFETWQADIEGDHE